MRVPIMVAALIVPSAAHAFCGTYAGGAGSEIYNNASSVILAREGDMTTLTVANDFEGDTADFALLIPVPEILTPEDVTVADPAVFATVDLYSAPRTVSYRCDDAVTETHWPAASGGCGLLMGCSESSLDSGAGDIVGGEASDGVTVEAEFGVAEYDIVVLSAEGAGGLYTWLDQEGFSIPAGGEDVLQGYIDAGTYFLAAKVSLDPETVQPGSTWLSPLQFRYRSDVLSLPVQIGTISSGGVQDLIIYVVSDSQQQVGIANYPEAVIEDECMLTSDVEDFAGYYLDRLDEVTAETDRAAWVVEYGWKQSPMFNKCDPCTFQTTPQLGTAPVLLNLQEMGYERQDAYFTRIHMRYDPGQVDEDLVFYTNGTNENSQIRFVEYVRELEFAFPICGEEPLENPGYCGDSFDEARPEVGCSTMTMQVSSFFAFWMVLFAMRRRRS